jgi:hypothetical protein
VIINSLSPTGSVLIARASIGWAYSVSLEEVQAPSADLKDPVITEVSNGKYAEWQPVSASPPVNIYDGYLHLKGKRGPVGGGIRFVVQNEGASKDAPGPNKGLYELPGDVRLSETGDWEATLDLSQPSLKLNGKDAHGLWVRAEDKGKHRYSAAALLFKIAPTTADLNAPSIGVIPEANPADQTNNTTFLTKAERLTVPVTLDKSMRPDPDAQVVVVDEAGGAAGVVVATKPAGTATVNVSVTKLVEGKHRFTAAVARGTKISPASAPVDLVIKRGGLRVQSVSPTNLGTTPGARAITIQFAPANRLDRDAAQNPASYRVRRSMGSGSFDLGADQEVSNPFAAGAAGTGGITFDEASNSVLLRFTNELVVDLYQLEIVSAALDPGTGMAMTPPAPTTTSTPAAGGAAPAAGTAGTVKAGIRDIFGNALEDANGVQGRSYKKVLGKPAAGGGFDGGDLPSVSRGITGRPGPFVPFPEYTPPRTPIDGVSPSDRVETRVVRLYYYRDAHRVAQIVNRNVKSYNYQAVEVRRRLADKARDVANQLTDQRRALERQAVEAARQAREAEAALAQAQQALAQARQVANQASAATQTLDPQILAAQTQLDQATQRQKEAQDELARRKAVVPPDPASAAKVQADVKQAQDAFDAMSAAALDARIRLSGLQQQAKTAQANLAAEANNLSSAEQQVRTALANVQAQRNAEVAANEKALATTAQEERAKEEQFRREVAAAHEDPDTYAPGVPNSQDPVQQCSISVIGEGEIQLRGPIKGMNIIRMMINQIDAPVGQVRVAIHTAQVNGEHLDRMEKVVARIQKYIDHSRFLTSQSAQMLRKAVVLVGSRKAEQAALTCPPGSQGARDQKYLYAFFGQDFIQELEALDSEFLKTGNKLLSLHSMDSTSLASALFLLALAKNSTRQEILEEFARMTATELPAAEMAFFEEAGPAKDCKKFQLLAYNARFQSLRGFFDAEVMGDETMTPIQREFVRLAQIFKSRLVTELELNQRVIERTIIEERFGKSYKDQILEQRAREDAANDALARTQLKLNEARTTTFQALAEVAANIKELIDKLLEGSRIAELWEQENRGKGQLFREQYQKILSDYRQTIVPAGVNVDAELKKTTYSLLEHADLYSRLAKQFGPNRSKSQQDLLKKLEATEIDRLDRKLPIRLQPVDGKYDWFFQEGSDAIWNQWVTQAEQLGRLLEGYSLPQEQQSELKVKLGEIRGLHSVGGRVPAHPTSTMRKFYSLIRSLFGDMRPRAQDIQVRSERLLAAWLFRF